MTYTFSEDDYKKYWPPLYSIDETFKWGEYTFTPSDQGIELATKLISKFRLVLDGITEGEKMSLVSHFMYLLMRVDTDGDGNVYEKRGGQSVPQKEKDGFLKVVGAVDGYCNPHHFPNPITEITVWLGNEKHRFRDPAILDLFSAFIATSADTSNKDFYQTFLSNHVGERYAKTLFKFFKEIPSVNERTDVDSDILYMIAVMYEMVGVKSAIAKTRKHTIDLMRTWVTR